MTEMGGSIFRSLTAAFADRESRSGGKRLTYDAVRSLLWKFVGWFLNVYASDVKMPEDQR